MTDRNAGGHLSALRIDYPGADQSAGAGHPKPDAGAPADRKRWRPVRLAWWAVAVIVLAVLPFVLLVRGGVFAYHQWGLGAWLSLALSAAATTLLLALYAWGTGRRMGAGIRFRRFLTRMTVLTGAAFMLYSVLVVAGGNVKSEEVRAEFSGLHPLLRIGVSVVVLVDPGAVITDAERSPDFYARAGLPANESSLHFRQDDGFVHALDLRTVDRPEWRNQATELVFRAMGFQTLRHVGTADHLHVSLRLAG